MGIRIRFVVGFVVDARRRQRLPGKGGIRRDDLDTAT
jgi:hypothetical protein